MPKMNVSRSVEIDAPLDTVRPLLINFRHWPQWSPWLCQEPQADVQYQGPDGAVSSGYSWSGQRIGAGSMTLDSATDKQLDCSLTFLKPFKSRAAVRFELQALDGDRCRVAWHMDSSLPFFMFFMRKMFEAFIGHDYTRGLAMLKELAETGTVHSAIELCGIDELPATNYIGARGHGKMADLGPLMQSGYPALYSAIDAADLSPSGPAYCHYTLMDPVKDRWAFLMAVPVSGDATPDGFERGHRAAYARCAHLRHTGHYTHLGNAWATAFSWIRADKLKHARKHGGFEVYLDNPAETDSAQRRTELFVPLK